MNSLAVDQFTAWIEIDGVPAPVYDAATDAAGKSATGWIASEAGKSFTVCWRDISCAFDTSGKVTVDGHKCGATLHRASAGQRTVHRGGLRVSKTSRRPFVFAPLTTTDDDRYLDASLNGLGDVCLKIYHVDNIVRAPFKPGRAMDAPKVHERAKKAAGHHVQLGTLIRAHTQQRTQSKHVAKVADFVFRYRPLARLQADGIAPLAEGAAQSNDDAFVEESGDAVDESGDAVNESGDAVNESGDAVNESGDAARIRQLEAELAELRGRRREGRCVKHEGRGGGVKREARGGGVKREGRGGGDKSEVKQEADTSMGEVIDMTEIKQEERIPIRCAADGTIDLTSDD